MPKKNRSTVRSRPGARVSAAICAFAALVLCAGAGPSAAQAAGPEANIRLAQSTRSDEYLPPWQRGNRDARAGDGYDQPRRIGPRQESATVYDSTHSTTRGGPPPRDRYVPPQRDDMPPPYEEGTYSSNEIVEAGHRFFGGVSKGLAKVVEHAFGRQGRPNGYILGEEGGGAIIAGLRYGEGTLYTKNAGIHRVYWQGPSLGYDFGAEGSKTLILVYNLSDVSQIYHRYAGVDGSAYFVGGIGITFQTYDDVVLAPIRSGVGLRLGANVGYLKYTRTPTWNPF